MRTGTFRKMGLFPAALMIRCFALGLCSAMILLSGCAAGGKSTGSVRHYALEYSAPAFKEMEPVNDSIRVEPLSIVRTFNTTSMVYRSRPFVYGDDAYHRWKVKPSVMISDLLLRDLKVAGLFRGVFSSGDAENGMYDLGGVIEEMYELEDSNGSHAVLALNVTLLKASRPDTHDRTVFQKNYRSVQVMQNQGAESLARSMSKAMETLSKEITLDIYRAMRRNGDYEMRDSAAHGLSAK